MVGGKPLDVTAHPEYLRFFFSLFQRGGGVTGPSASDLEISQFEDAGIEELKSVLFSSVDATAGSSETASLISRIEAIENAISTESSEVASLRSRIEALENAMSAMEQGQLS